MCVCVCVCVCARTITIDTCDRADGALELCMRGYHVYSKATAGPGKSYCVSVSPGTRRTVIVAVEIYFAGLIFAVLLHPRIPRKFPHCEINCNSGLCSSLTEIIESAIQPSPVEKSRTTLHYIILNDSARDLVLPPLLLNKSMPK